MSDTKLNFEKFRWARLLELAAVVILMASCFPARSMAQQRGQRTFSSAAEASSALIAAMQSNDEKALLNILGPGAKQIVSSGDSAEDEETRANFVKRYQEMHRLVKEPDGATTLYIGAMNWPSPIPLMNKGSEWYFDTDAGKKEILYRRVGRNEMSAIKVCEELVSAEKEYRTTGQRDTYAAKIISGEGDKSGLYWKAANGEPQSPVGPLVAMAAAEESNSPMPYRGYYYHILTSQGKSAPGGAKSYVVNGKMTAGVAFVAYPAEYRSSGVMTFVVGEDGIVYQKDLGKKTDAQAKAMKEYNPAGWGKAEEQPEENAGAQKTQ